MMRRAILSLPGRKVIRHWFTEMLIGRWRPSAFSESVFVISRGFDLETTEIIVESQATLTLQLLSHPIFILISPYERIFEIRGGI